jgi:3-oxoadipate enol-lactonase
VTPNHDAIGWVDTGRVSLRYQRGGSGPTCLVLLHEMGGTLESWDFAVPALSKTRQTLRYDMRGFGQSEKTAGPLSYDMMADDLLSLLDALDIKIKVAIAGGAVGGGVALHFAVRHPQRAAAIIAMSPSASVPPERKAAVLDRSDFIEREGLRAIVEGSFATAYPEILRQDAERHDIFRARWLGNDPRSFAASNRMLANADIIGGFSKITCPCLVISGTHDLVRPPAMVEPVAKMIPGATYLELASGHFMATQNPGELAEAIGAFLKPLGI